MMVRFTIKRGISTSTSLKQHRFVHARALDHTHTERGRRKRETFTLSERRQATIRAKKLGFIPESSLPKRFR